MTEKHPLFPDLEDFQVSLLEGPGVNSDFREFLFSCYLNQLFEKVPEARHRKNWNRNLGILFFYCFTEASSVQIGRDYDFTPQGIYKLIHKTAHVLWEQADPEVQAAYPLEKLLVKKEGGLPRNADENATPYELRLRYVRKRKKSLAQGEELPPPWERKGKLDYEELARKLEQAATDVETQELLNQVSLRFYRKHSKGESPLLTTVSDFLSTMPHRYTFSQAAELIKKSGIPFNVLERELLSGKKIGTKQRYYFFATKDLPRVKQLLFPDSTQNENAKMT
jgi:hypothetical protein